MRTVLLLACLWVAAEGWGQEFPLEQFRTFRDHEGLAIPLWDEGLAATCRETAYRLAAAGQLSHEDTDGNGPGRQLMLQGFPPGVYGEVLGAGADPGTVWKAWLASPAHRRVLVEPLWTGWGWGAYRSGRTTVWVVRFWRP